MRECHLRHVQCNANLQHTSKGATEQFTIRVFPKDLGEGCGSVNAVPPADTDSGLFRNDGKDEHYVEWVISLAVALRATFLSYSLLQTRLIDVELRLRKN